VTDKQRLELLRAAKKELKLTTQGYVQWVADGKQGGHWAKAMLALNKLEDDFKPDPVPLLGPVKRGGKSILDYQLTHNTDGIPLYPAFDDNWGSGAIAIAPEAMTVITPYTSANPGAAFYARGESKLKYWIGHLTRSPSIGTKFVKGQEVGRSVAQSGAEHTHWGINAEALLGEGKQLKYGRDGNGPDYTYGSPTIGGQLRAAL
jgi:hypothetical protein